MNQSENRLLELYQKTVLAHSQRPFGAKRLVCPTLTADGVNPICGDRVTVDVSLNSDGRLVDIAFRAESCALCLASASVMCREIHDRYSSAPLNDVIGFVRKFLISIDPKSDLTMDGEQHALTVVRSFPARAKCVALPWNTLRMAYEKHASKQRQANDA